jgi:hypothetical protein
MTRMMTSRLKLVNLRTHVLEEEAFDVWLPVLKKFIYGTIAGVPTRTPLVVATVAEHDR